MDNDFFPALDKGSLIIATAKNDASARRLLLITSVDIGSRVHWKRGKRVYCLSEAMATDDLFLFSALISIYIQLILYNMTISFFRTVKMI